MDLARKYGWHPGARYTNLRDIKHVVFTDVGFLDVDWKFYDFHRHLDAASALRPLMTVARDIECISALDEILSEAEQLRRFARHVILVPKDVRLKGRFDQLLPEEFVLGFSVPTRYGGTCLPPSEYARPVHLLGGRPDVQRRFAAQMPVISVDCNRFTLDARYGDYFDGEIFRPHPEGGYDNCLERSIVNITRCWEGYSACALRTRPITV